MTSPARERKRHRPPSDPDDGTHTDDDERHVSEDLGPRPGQAERKRELERNRRNLVNVRFIELEAELRRCMPRPDHSVPGDAGHAPVKGKRIDKEAVLKDAAQRLSVQRKDLAVAGERLASMTAEIENLRAEKVELRSDKNYLRSELETVRGDVQRLRSDNINLWQAFRKASSFKDAFAADVAKIPAELFLRSPPDQLTTTAPARDGMMQAIAPMRSGPTVPQSQNPLQGQHSTLPPSQVPSSAPQSQPPAQPQQGAQQPPRQQPKQQQRQQQQEHRQGQTRSQGSQREGQVSSPLLRDPQSGDLQQSVLSMPPQIQTASQVPNSTMTSDSFLILQTPEELGELFNSYVPGAMTSNFSTSSPQRTDPTQTGGIGRFSPGLGITSSTALPTGQSPLPQEMQGLGKAYDPPQQSPFIGLNASDGATGSSPKTEKEEEPFSDVAYCV